MDKLELTAPTTIASALKSFLSEASDLYIDFLTDGRKKLAESLLSGLLIAVASLDRISDLPAGPERSKELRHAASVFHKLSLLIFVSSVTTHEGDGTDLRILQIYDAAADLSGSLARAARHGL